MNAVAFAAKNVLRNRFRTALTVLGVAVAVLTFVLLRTALWAWSVGAEAAAKDRVVTRHKVTFIMPLPKRYIDQVRAMPGVKEATWANWFGGKDPKHDREFFGTFAIDPETYFSVYDEMVVPPADLAAFKENRSAAIVGTMLAKKFGWKKGDEITLESAIFPGAWKFQIAGIYEASRKSVDNSSLVFHWKYLNESANLPARSRDHIGWVVSRIDDPKKVAAAAVAIDKAFEDRETQTLSQDEGTFNKSFLAMMDGIMSALNVVSLVILAIMGLILGNTIAMGVRERTSEYGVLRAIGFLPRHVALFILGEAVVTGALGGALGVALSYPIVEKGLGGFLEENMGTFFPFFRVDPPIAAAALALAAVLGAASAVLPALRASRTPVIEALRRVA
jgi:putative ABC transport system permease protein